MTSIDSRHQVGLPATRDADRAGRAIAFLHACFEPEAKRFRFTPGGVVSSMSSYYSILALEHLGALNASLRADLKTSLATRAESDSAVTSDRILSARHPAAYFEEERQAFLLQVRDALGLDPLAGTGDPSVVRGKKPDDLAAFFSSLPWDDPWRDSNRVMFALSHVAALIVCRGREDLRVALHAALDWLDARQSSLTGLWSESPHASLAHCMAATFHFTFFYFWIGRSLLHADRIIDSCLSLQEGHGLFSGPFQIGQSCLDYDAIDLLVKASLLTKHRRGDVLSALERARTALVGLQNPDGGYPNCRERIVARWSLPGLGRVQRKAIRVNLPLVPRQLIARQVPSQEQYDVCLDSLRCRDAESNVFSTWFRSLTIDLCDTLLDPASGRVKTTVYRRLPFLGYHSMG